MHLEIPAGTFRAYLFDCDGTIADSMPLHYNAWKKALAEYGCNYDEDLFYSWGGKPVRKIIADLNQIHGLNMPVEVLAARKEAYYHEQLPTLKAIPSVLEHVEAQYGRIPFAVVSGSRRDSVVGSLTALGILDKFETLVCAEDPTSTANPLPIVSYWPPSALRCHLQIAWSLKTPNSALKLQRPQAWLQSESLKSDQELLLSSARNNSIPDCLDGKRMSSTGTQTTVVQSTTTARRDLVRSTARTSGNRPSGARKLTNYWHGFHRDELQFLSDARHLDWGFVSYPPLTPFLQHMGLAVFGQSLVGLRLCSDLAQALAIVAVGLMTRDLGGSRIAQVTAALVVMLSPLPLFNGTEFQYTSFDFLWWVLIAWFTVRSCSRNGRSALVARDWRRHWNGP